MTEERVKIGHFEKRTMKLSGKVDHYTDSGLTSELVERKEFLKITKQQSLKIVLL